MNSLDLSKEQKDHLLEMCNKLFPEYIFEFIMGEDSYGYTLYDLFTFCLIKDYENCEYEKSRKYIHWFEFCNRILFKKIFGDSDDNQYTNGSIDMTDYECYIVNMFKSNDIIDYLYERFKRKYNN